MFRFPDCACNTANKSTKQAKMRVMREIIHPAGHPPWVVRFSEPPPIAPVYVQRVESAQVVSAMRLKSSLVVLCACGCLLVPATAQDSNKQDGSKKDKSAEKRETIAKPMTDKQRRQQQDRLRKELETPYKKWLTE